MDYRLTPGGLVFGFILLGTWSLFLYKDQPWYKTAQNLFVGAAASLGLIVSLSSLQKSTFTPLINGQWTNIIPIVLGILVFAKFVPKISWLGRFPVAVAAGVGISVSIRTYIRANFLEQIYSTMQLANLTTIEGIFGTTTDYSLNRLLFIIITVSTLTYFTFSLILTKNRIFTPISKLGRYGIMIALGLAYGATVLTRISMSATPMLFLALGIYL